MKEYLFKSLIKLLNFPILFAFKLHKVLNRKNLIRNAIIAQLSDDKQLGENFYCVSKDTQIRIPIMNVFNHIMNGFITFKINSFYVKKYTDANIFPSSDFILTDIIVDWPKLHYPHFTKIVPLDKQLIKIENSSLYINRPKKVYEKQIGFSLCGVHSNVWSHFLVQYLPKLEYLDEITKDSQEIVTIITPYYLDPQINEIVHKLTANLNCVEILRLEKDESAFCKTLYHLENTAIISDHAKYISPSDFIIPDFVKIYLKEKFINNPLVFSQNNTPNPIHNRKLFIARKQSTLSPLSGLRSLTNYDEVEFFFKKKGFELVFPHEYTLDEKKKLFSEASIIVGPYSSGFTNIIFCQPKTKALVFTNFQRIYDTYVSTLADFFEIKLLAVTGKDVDSGDIHSSYSIPINSIKEAYNELMRIHND